MSRPWTNEEKQHRGVRRPTSRGGVNAQANRRQAQPHPDMVRLSVDTHGTHGAVVNTGVSDRHRARMGLPGFNMAHGGAPDEPPPDVADLARGWPVTANAHPVVEAAALNAAQRLQTPERQPSTEVPFSPASRQDINHARLQDFHALRARMQETPVDEPMVDTPVKAEHDRDGDEQLQQPASSPKPKKKAPEPSNKRGGCSAAWLRMSADAAHAPWSTIAPEGSPNADTEAVPTAKAKSAGWRFGLKLRNLY